MPPAGQRRRRPTQLRGPTDCHDRTEHAERLRGQIPPQPLDARRCADLLAELTGLQVDQADIGELEKRRLASVVDDYKGWDLYDVAALRAIGGDVERLAVLTEVVAERMALLVRVGHDRGARAS